MPPIPPPHPSVLPPNDKVLLRMQGGAACEGALAQEPAGAHHTAELGAAAGPASAERCAGRQEWPGTSSPHGVPHEGKGRACYCL